ncbi:MAG: PstS family phosphate ABC transporter substrate-binding protein [Calothrix sp. C42_A2020_038]|nr:PstS family phosphate ABC transporter substrate-binding protein [Calothrix sp. C42_A2020_038]
MKARLQKLAFALGLLGLVTSCTVGSNSDTQTSQSPSATPASSSEIISTIKIDGSSTVFPITQIIAKDYLATSKNRVNVTVDISGTGGGFKKFCAGETDISNASRPINEDEMQLCRQNNIEYIELAVAFDALSVIVNPQNDWAKDITVEELKKMWEPAAEGKITRWNQVRASWPDKPLNLFGPGKDSGTFDYFTDATVGKSKASRNDYTASEDDEKLVEGITKDPNALGYFGYAYYEKHKAKLKVLAVDNGKGPVEPSVTTVVKNQYQPLSRPLFIYVNPASGKNKSEVYQFANYYLQKAPSVASQVRYIALPDQIYQIGKVHLNKFKVGTAYGGQPQLNLTIGEVLRKQKQI